MLSYKAHHPTGRVSLESVLRTCIAEYGAAPLRADWEKTLELREGDFETWRSWSGSTPARPLTLSHLTSRNWSTALPPAR